MQNTCKHFEKGTENIQEENSNQKHLYREMVVYVLRVGIEDGIS